ncbi:galactokinase [Leptospira interrogans str. 2003000735]|uniref:Galactokinase n=6 Tax=Leptospira interrogans TaxID=173 RepID=A0AAP9WDV1_LEPIR|nr:MULTISPECIES: galactokinase [Leptospira]EMF72030.1 galactokinase [Leptospira interrogans serovar Canicola str. LT1962]EMN73988.1 galactokinase [Leptospira interrogans serovar Bataviae str. UI 08561]EMY02971.1 galactokinase [Leptospira interrogans str. 2002000626]EMY23202.1 galactokinase [Leptospira interrogans serovar Australis str. 200703203]KAA1269911.1 galactokinase [Leptospira interrogans serovar Weerasinghe]KAA1291060.1 galactokinase [Leptospira interrogans serovar Geyaweera]
MIPEDLAANLKKEFPSNEEKIRFFTAPGRINIIGEHVDYAGGIVLPAAIDFSIRIAIRKNQTRKFRIYSVASKEKIEVESITYDPKHAWVNYVYGIVEEFRKLDFISDFFDLVVWGNIPQGAGLSSSAAFEVVVAFALSEIHNWNLSKEEIALLSQRAENHFVGVNCGIMDQFIISTAREGYCISLDTESLEYDFHKMDLEGCEFYLIDSKIKHSLKDSAYNERRKEVESAFQKIKRYKSSVKTLYQVELEDLDNVSFGLSEIEKKRAKHVIGERLRTSKAIENLKNGNVQELGEILFECHSSLSKDYEVSCKETDFIVHELKMEEVLGARMIGGGFGGCVLVLDKVGRKNILFEKIKTRYFDKFQNELKLYSFKVSDGVREI